MQTVSSAAMSQFEGLKNIPYAVYQNWPAFFGFFVVDYTYGMLYSAIPRLGGSLGTVEAAALQGMSEVVRFVAWENLKMH